MHKFLEMIYSNMYVFLYYFTLFIELIFIIINNLLPFSW